MQAPDEDTKKSMAINALGENFGKEFSPALLELWLDMLAPYSSGQVQQAVKTVIERYEFKTLPPFAVLKKALDDLAGTGEKALELQALAEWGVLQRAIAQYGSYSKPPLHPTTEHVVRLLGGWDAACQWTVRDVDFRRKDFIRLWADCSGKEEFIQIGADAVLEMLANRCSAGNPEMHGGPLRELNW